MDSTSNKKKLDSAILDTYRKYSSVRGEDFCILQNIQGLLAYIKDTNPCYFARDNGIRKTIMSMEPESVRMSLCYEYVKDVISKPHITRNELNKAIQETYRKYSRVKGELNGLAVATHALDDYLEGTNHFTRDNNARANLQASEILPDNVLETVAASYVLETIEKEKRRQEELEQAANAYTVENVQINYDNVEKCRSSILSGSHLHCAEGDVALDGKMHASSRIGNVRKNQEDAVLLMKHPKNSDFKFLVVADGMGGLENGEMASNLVVEQLQNWFNNLDSKYYTNEAQITEQLDKALQEINDNIVSSTHGGGSTYVGAIVGKNKTLISNVGDSRAYLTNAQGQLGQITDDQAPSYRAWKAGAIPTKDDIRFDEHSHQIYEHLGRQGIKITPNHYLVNNKQYDSILLFSDGVTDCLSDEQILAVTRETPKEAWAQNIVTKALSTDSVLREALRSDGGYNLFIKGGKDNTTAAVLNQEGQER